MKDLSPRKVRVIKSAIIAGRYREEKNIIGGFIKVYNGKVIGVCDNMPKIKPEGGNPMLIDDSGNAFMVEEKKWRCIKFIVDGEDLKLDMMEYKTVLKEHIADVLLGEMLVFYKLFSEQIKEWIQSCKRPRNDKGWKCLECVTLQQAFDAMTSGMPLDSLLGKAKD